MSIRPAGDFKTTYAADMALLDTRFYRAGFLAVLLALALAPLWLRNYLYLLNIIGIFAIGACGLTLLTGFTGQISLGHAAFMAIGAYSSAVLTARLSTAVPTIHVFGVVFPGLGLWFPLAMPMAGAISFVFGALVGLPSLRIKGLYLAIATLAFQFLTEYAIIHAFGGVGAINVPAPQIGPWELAGETQFYYLLLVIWVAAGIFTANLARSRIGLAFMAIRDRDYAAQVLGINLLYFKTLAFGIAAFYAGVAGSLWAHYTRLITPEHFNVGTSIDFVAMVVIGGLTSVWGPHLGSAFVRLLSDGLRIVAPMLITVVPAFAKIATPLREIIFGVVLIALLIWEPGGLAMLLRKLKRRFDLWPFNY
ncbi:MAG TPA: branched-chain amino acid ABC transporter permease [bacterium]|jgi:branched-chain amino acid transport system permease protein|nr:branched-chain amino acid ABC transporter permease [bacterium]